MVDEDLAWHQHAALSILWKPIVTNAVAYTYKQKPYKMTNQDNHALLEVTQHVDHLCQWSSQHQQLVIPDYYPEKSSCIMLHANEKSLWCDKVQLKKKDDLNYKHVLSLKLDLYDVYKYTSITSVPLFCVSKNDRTQQGLVRTPSGQCQDKESPINQVGIERKLDKMDWATHSSVPVYLNSP